MDEFQQRQEHCPKQHGVTAEFFECPECKGQVEIWSDEKVGTCTSCSGEFPKPK